jgi:hypothetical protein
MTRLKIFRLTDFHHNAIERAEREFDQWSATVEVLSVIPSMGTYGGAEEFASTMMLTVLYQDLEAAR